jgi:hypothetical protein
MVTSWFETAQERLLTMREEIRAFCRLRRGLSPLPFCYLNALATLSTPGSFTNADAK